MPAPDIPTTEEIKDRIISDIESYIGQETPILFKAFNRILAITLAGAFTVLYKFGQWGLKQIFTITQDEDSLELKRVQYDIIEKPAQAATLTAGFTGINGTIIPAAQQFRGNANGLLYSVESSLEIIAGVASGNVQCLTAGEVGNLINGSIITILQPIADLDNQATISGIVIEGEDAETVEEKRSRISAREKLPPQGGSTADYLAWSREVEGITRAFAFGHRDIPSITIGHIHVYPLSDNDPGGRVPSTAKLEEVHDYIDSPSRAPMQAVVINVLPMVEKTFNILVTSIAPDTLEIQSAFAENVEAYLLEREPQQFTGQLDLKNVVSRSGIEAIYINSGAQSVVLTIEIVGTGTVENYTLENNELAILGTITGP